MKKQTLFVVMMLSVGILVSSQCLPAFAGVTQNINIGKMALNMKDEVKAEVFFQKAIKDAPEDANVYRQIGYLYYGAGFYHAAAKYLEEAKWLSPKDSDTNYFLGLAYLNDGQPEPAIQALKTVVQDEKYKEYATYYLGVANFNRQDYLKARGIFNQAESFSDELSGEAQLYAGRASIHLREYKAAEETLERLSASRDLNKNIVEAAGEELRYLRKFWSVYADIAVGYDSNVLQLADDEEINPALGISDRGDFFSELGAGGSLRLLRGKYHELIGSYKFEGTFFDEVKAQQSLSNSFTGEWTLFFGSVRPSISYEYEDLKFDSEDFAEYHNVEPSITFELKPDWPTRVYYLYRNINRYDDDSRSGHRQSYGLSQMVPLPKSCFLYFTYEYSIVDTKGDPLLGTDFDSFRHRLIATLGAPYTLRFSQRNFPVYLQASLDSSFTQFDDLDPMENVKRKENYFEASVQLSHNLTDNLALVVGFSYAYNVSNIDRLDYSKGVGSIGLRASF